MIRSRTQELTSIILDIWKVPEGYLSKVNRSKEDAPQKIKVIDLMSARLVAPGQTLYPRMKKHEGRNAQILLDGRIEVEGVVYDSLSYAGVAICQRSINGWTFWLTSKAPKVRMSDLRDRYKEIIGAESPEDSIDDDSEDEE